MNEQDKFVILDKDGNEKSFYKMITFKSSLTNKTYLIYTDNEYTDGKINIYSSILVSDDDNGYELEEITNKDDMEEVKKALVKAKVESE